MGNSTHESFWNVITIMFVVTLTIKAITALFANTDILLNTICLIVAGIIYFIYLGFPLIVLGYFDGDFD